MQELEYFRGEATLVISLDGLNWLSRRRCSDKGNKKRDEELQVWISSAQTILANKKQQPVTCVCILDQRKSSALNLWRNAEHRLSLVTQSSSCSFSPQHCCLQEESNQNPVFNSLASSVSECPKETTWTKLILNMRDVFTLITKKMSFVTKQNILTMDHPDTFTIFCDDDVPSRLYSDICYIQDCGTFEGNTGCHISDNNNVSTGDLKSSTARLSSDPNNNPETEMAVTDNFNVSTRKSLLKSCQNYNRQEESSGGDRKMRKSVSFDDDVIVYLFDQESPTLKLHSEPYTSLPNNSSCNLSDVTSDDSGLEWEDDFSALEKNCHFQCVSRSQRCTLSLPTHSWTPRSRPDRYFLSQTCLFLTHVTESDLEL